MELFPLDRKLPHFPIHLDYSKSKNTCQEVKDQDALLSGKNAKVLHPRLNLLRIKKEQFRDMLGSFRKRAVKV